MRDSEYFKWLQKQSILKHCKVHKKFNSLEIVIIQTDVTCVSVCVCVEGGGVVHLPQVSLEWVLIGFLHFITKSVWGESNFVMQFISLNIFKHKTFFLIMGKIIFDRKT